MKSIKNAKSKYFLLPDLSRKRMGLLKRKKNVFYFLLKIPNLNLYLNQKRQTNISYLHRASWSSKKRNKTTTNKQRKTKEKINK